MSVEKYLKPNVIHQIKRLDLRAQFVVKGFLHGLHASPFHGYSVQFAEHRKYTPGDEPRTLCKQCGTPVRQGKCTNCGTLPKP